MSVSSSTTRIVCIGGQAILALRNADVVANASRSYLTRGRGGRPRVPGPRAPRNAKQPGRQALANDVRRCASPGPADAPAPLARSDGSRAREAYAHARRT